MCVCVGGGGRGAGGGGWVGASLVEYGGPGTAFVYDQVLQNRTLILNNKGHCKLK